MTNRVESAGGRIASGLSIDISSGLTPARSPSVAPVISNNQRLEKIFDLNPDYVNREYVLPCSVDYNRSYMSPKIRGTQIEQVIKEHLGTIVTPFALEKCSDRMRSQLRVLASPYECGRVLELDHEVVIDGKPYVINMKGVGATTFARNTGASNPWGRAPDFKEEDRLELSRFAFHKKFGVCLQSAAASERDNVQIFRENGVHAERVLGIYPIERMADGSGNIRPISYFQKFGIINPRSNPVILVRASHTNLRLMDLVMLVETDRTESIPAVIEYAKRTYGTLEQVANPSANEYLNWLANRVLAQELPLILKGFKLGSNRWQDTARNISLLGEELDLEAVSSSPDRYESPSRYLSHVKEGFSCIETSLRSFGGILSRYGGEAIDFERFAHTVIECIEKAVYETSIFQIQSRFTRDSGGNFADFQNDTHRALYEKFSNNYLLGADQAGVDCYGRILEERFNQFE